MSVMTAGITKAGEGIEGISWNILGQTYVPKQLCEASFSWHATLPPGTMVPPHIHPTQDEFIYMFEGDWISSSTAPRASPSPAILSACRAASPTASFPRAIARSNACSGSARRAASTTSSGSSTTWRTPTPPKSSRSPPSTRSTFCRRRKRTARTADARRRADDRRRHRALASPARGGHAPPIQKKRPPWRPVDGRHGGQDWIVTQYSRSEIREPSLGQAGVVGLKTGTSVQILI